MTATADVQARLNTASLMLLMAGIAAVGLQALMLSPLLTDIAHTLNAGPRELGFASGAYGAGVALMAFLVAPRLGHWPKRTAIRCAFAVMTAGLSLSAGALPPGAVSRRRAFGAHRHLRLHDRLLSDLHIHRRPCASASRNRRLAWRSSCRLVRDRIRCGGRLRCMDRP